MNTLNNFSIDDFKQSLGAFTSGVTVITFQDQTSNNAKNNSTSLSQENLYGVTISSFSSLSLKPPMISFNLGKDSNIHDPLVNSKYFAVNILADDQIDISHKFSKNFKNRWSGINYQEGKSGAPIIQGVKAYIECSLEAIYQGGDHSIITGKIIHLGSNKNLMPLIHFGGHYYKLGEKIS